MPPFKRRLRIAMVACVAALIGGCGLLDSRSSRATTPLVGFLYGDDGEVPKRDAPVELTLPIRVGLAFLPPRPGTSHSGPGAIDEQRVLDKVRENFRSLPYVSEIVAVPSYYLSPARGDGLQQLQQLARLQNLDLIALVSYDQYSDTRANRRALAYITIVGALAVRGTHNETHTIIDLAVVDPQQRTLVLRAGGVSSDANTVAAVDQSHSLRKQQRRGFDVATDDMIGRFKLELAQFEARVRAGTADVRVVKDHRKSSGVGTGSMDPLMLALLAAILVVSALRARKTLSPRRSGVPGLP
jgi:rhombotail lipoprotein